jgi:hypothetical protein
MREKFLQRMLERQVKAAIRKNPELEDDSNGLVLAVWQANGLKLRRKQTIKPHLLPDGGSILQAYRDIQTDAEIVALQPDAAPVETEPAFLDMETEPAEPAKSKAKKITVKKK